jgi:uncharacterized protein YcbK (DUF882 family)
METELHRRQAIKTILCGIAFAATPSIVYARFPTKNRTGKLSFFNVNTNESITDVRYVQDSGRFDRTALEELNYFFRCGYDGKVHPIDPGLFYWLDIVKTQLGFPAARFRLYSGYRSPRYNRLLRKRGYRAAKNSFHLHGRAADIKLEGVALSELERKAESLQFGGVSRYRSFVHVDVGPNRTW